MTGRENISKLESEVSLELLQLASDKTRQLLKLEGLKIPQKGTLIPQRKILVATTWRSGSSIVGDWLNSMKGSNMPGSDYMSVYYSFCLFILCNG